MIVKPEKAVQVTHDFIAGARCGEFVAFSQTQPVITTDVRKLLDKKEATRISSRLLKPSKTHAIKYILSFLGLDCGLAALYTLDTRDLTQGAH